MELKVNYRAINSVTNSITALIKQKESKNSRHVSQFF